mgnify:CR=1 FL=1
MTNFGLMMLSQAVRHKIAWQKKKKNKNKKFSFRATKFACTLIPLLYGSVSGEDFTALVVCCSQLPANASQTINALDFGATFSELNVNAKRCKSQKLQTVIKAATKIVNDNAAALNKPRAGGKKNRYTLIRQAKLRDAQQLLELLKRFEAE